ncbi:formimidoylglutamate deiminase, partial [Escherichia coli]
GFGGQPASEGQRRFINGSEAYLELLQRLRAPLEAAGHSLGLFFPSLPAVTPQQIPTVPPAGHDDLPVPIHIAEQQKEVDDCQA